MVVVMNIEDYGYCKTCNEYFDLWKYGDIENAGHESCKWRYVTPEELKGLIENCKRDGCFDET